MIFSGDCDNHNTMRKYTYLKIAPADVGGVWTKVAPLITKAMATSRGEANAEHFRRSLVKGQMDLFVAANEGEVVVAMVTQFIQHANYTALRVCVLAGSEPKVLSACVDEYWPELIEWSKTQGATKWEAYCHVGMARLLQKHGFGERYAVVVKDLEN